MDFEKKLGRLEEIVSEMEKGELSLEDSLKVFEEGVKISRQCQKQLSEAEQRVQKLLAVDEDGNALTEDFPVGKEFNGEEGDF